MKPGMQRDILIAFWLLFDEFEIADSDPPSGDQPAHTSATTPPTQPGARPTAGRLNRHS